MIRKRGGFENSARCCFVKRELSFVSVGEMQGGGIPRHAGPPLVMFSQPWLSISHHSRAFFPINPLPAVLYCTVVVNWFVLLYLCVRTEEALPALHRVQ